MRYPQEPKSALVFGSNGNLAEAWVSTLTDLHYEVYGFGKEEVSNSRSLKFTNYTLFDVTKNSEDQVRELIESYSADVIIYNSGIDSLPGEGKEKLNEYSLNSWREIFEVNLIGAVKVLNAISIASLPPSRVILIGSMYATSSPITHLYSHYGPNGQQKHPAYSASKSALLAAMKQYAVTLAARGTILNMLSPGAIEGKQDKFFIEKISERIPANRLGNIDDLRSALRFLSDESNKYFIGQNLIIDGGMNVW